MTEFKRFGFSKKGSTLYPAQLISSTLWIPDQMCDDQIARNKGTPVAAVVHHFDRCYVMEIVRLIKKDKWCLTTRDLGQPNVEPWFLICSAKDHANGTNMQFFLVNAEYEVVPLQSYARDDFPELSQLGVLDLRVQCVSWPEFSAVDRLIVEEAIQGFLEGNK